MESLKTYNSTLELLTSAPVPAQTRTYKPVSHSSLIDLTMNGIEKAGFILGKARYSSARDGQVANGRFTITNVADSEMELQIGWQNSYDRSMSLKFAIGTRILVCSNGCVSGDYGAFKKRHKGDIQDFTPSAITDYIKQAGEAFKLMQQQREAMKQVEITRRVKAELIGRMMIEEQFISSTQLNIISKELTNPSHDYGAPDSLWELYNYTTFAMKEIHPTLWMQNHIQAHKFFNEYSENVIDLQPEETFTQISIF